MSVLLRKQRRKQRQSTCPNSKLKYTREKQETAKKRVLLKSEDGIAAMELKKRYYKYNGVNKHTERLLSVDDGGKQRA